MSLKISKSLQKGRSMVEVIAILAVMGILLIAGLVGFKFLLDYLKQKQTIEQVTTIGMRYQASRLNAKANPETGYVNMGEVYPEGDCEDKINTQCDTPEGGEVRLYSFENSKNFVVLAKTINSQTCEEIALMGGYEFAFGTKNYPSDDEADFPNIEENDPEDFPGTEANPVINNEGESYAFTPEYLRKNPNALKVFCDTNIPLKGFMYTDGNCKYMCGGVCKSCPCDEVADRTGDCCAQSKLDDSRNCGLCEGCPNGKKCIEAEERCVECVDNNDCNGNPNEKYCLEEEGRCVECDGNPNACDADECCNARYECVDFDEDFWSKGTADGSCQCIQGTFNKGDLCDADCNCSHLGANFHCSLINGQKRCTDSPTACKENGDCGNGWTCCKENPAQTYGVCCDPTKICKDGVCENCEGDADCTSGHCCLGSCYDEAKTVCGSECCDSDQECLGSAPNKYCGNDADSCATQGLEFCASEGEHGDCCELGQICHDTEGCIDCPNEAYLTCGANEMDPFNITCFKKKHLNCVDESNTKDEEELVKLIPSDTTAICGGGNATTNAGCGPCTQTSDCKTIKNKDAVEISENTPYQYEYTDATGVKKTNNITFKDFVCRLEHTGADADKNGTCGPCLDETDCPSGLPCLNGKCGCENDTDCAKNCDGKTICDTNRNVCVCGENLRENTDGQCECTTNPAYEFWRFKDNATNYMCCADGYRPGRTTGGFECYQICGDEQKSIKNVAIFVDYSYSTIKENDTITNSIKNTARSIINAVEDVNKSLSEKIQIGVFREDTGVGEGEAGQLCFDKDDKDKPNPTPTNPNITLQSFGESYNVNFDQDYCAYNCGGQGTTCFTKAIEKIEGHTDDTLLFILSDGIIPLDTASRSGVDTDKIYAFFDGDKDLTGLNSENMYDFQTMHSESIINAIKSILITETCVEDNPDLYLCQEPLQ